MKEITKDDLFNALLRERLMLIKRVVTEEHDEEEFAMSWSDGKDSCVMSALFDMALPDNKIPRVYDEYRRIGYRLKKGDVYEED